MIFEEERLIVDELAAAGKELLMASFYARSTFFFSALDNKWI